MIKWSDIPALKGVVPYVRRNFNISTSPAVSVYPTLMFRGSVKLHGSNASITRKDGKFGAQSRENVLSLEKDNYGFASWVHRLTLDPDTLSQLNSLFDSLLGALKQHKDSDSITVNVYGEWVGPGIQKGVAISQLPSKQLFIFGAKLGVPNHILKDMDEFFEPEEEEDSDGFTTINIENNTSLKIVHPEIHNILSFPTFFVSIDFNIPTNSLNELQDITLAVEEKCPVAAKFGFEGIGEGVVWVCLEQPTNTALWFKTKGEKHSGKSATRIKNVAVMEPEVIQRKAELVDYLAKHARLVQGLEHCEPKMEELFKYIKWVCGDILKEEADTIAVSGFTWKQLVSAINDKCRAFFINNINQNL